MSETLISHSPDLLRLRNEGYRLRIVEGTGLHILVEIPYVNSRREVRWGVLVAPLTVNAGTTTRPVSDTHQAWFIGEHPCNVDGTEIFGIKHGSQRTDRGDGIVVDHSFSAKPLNAVPYADYYAKVKQYADIISSPARSIDANVQPFDAEVAINSGGSVFLYPDTATSRAGIGAVSQKLKMPRLAIVGLGGTGSYVLDLVAKTHVQEIHLFDGDRFSQHNAFRSPGAPGLAELTSPFKVDYFAGIYSKMRRGIVPHAYHIDAGNAGELSTFGFVFVCIDKPEARKAIVDALHAAGVPFIDVGMDLQMFRQESLMGQCRVTLSTPMQHDHLSDRVSFAEAQVDGIYPSNIQVADMNALDAALAVIKWKKYCGFYLEQIHEHHSVYAITTHGLTKDVRT
jgi:molybdopterin/thiamine biosynthesis adenylyltransferase